MFVNYLLLIILFAMNTFASNAPSPNVRADRIDPNMFKLNEKKNNDVKIEMPSTFSHEPISPEGAKSKIFLLKKVRLIGVNHFDKHEFDRLFEKFLNKNISLHKAFAFASWITRHYENRGYFLSRAYVPTQNITDGILYIKVIEGYISNIEFDKEYMNYRAAQEFMKDILSKKPLNIKDLESAILRLNDVPNFMFRSVMSNAGFIDGKVKLKMIPVESKDNFSASLDNNLSRFFGNTSVAININKRLFIGHKTTVTLVSGMPDYKYYFANFNHLYFITQKISMETDTSVAINQPSHDLSDKKVLSKNINVTTGLNYYILRQKTYNLNSYLKFSFRNSTNKVLNQPLITDGIRFFKFGNSYTNLEFYLGSLDASLEYTQGLNAFEPTSGRNINSTNVKADPRFFKVSSSFDIKQSLSNAFVMQLSGQLQYAGTAIYSSEQIGYGGQAFGKAYDPSEIIADAGTIFSFNISYIQLSPFKNSIYLVPKFFTDYGRLYNKSDYPKNAKSAASFGSIIEFIAKENVSGNFGVAYPLIKKITTPQYSFSSNAGPRIIFSLGFRK